MPLHDHQCTTCGYIFEEVVAWNQKNIDCPKCFHAAQRVYLSFKGIKHDAPDWLQDTLNVVDKEGDSHCKEFLKHPTRNTYNNWMKGEGIRPMDEGESMKRNKVDTSGIRERVHDKFRERNTIEVRS